jgi:uncharacterized Fe-S cluster-containing protein
MVIKRCDVCGYKRQDVYPHEAACGDREVKDMCESCRERDREGYEEQMALYAEWTRDAEDAVRGGLW